MRPPQRGARSAADTQSGLLTLEFLQRWSGPAGLNALPVGLALLRLDSMIQAPDDRAAYYLARRVAATLTQPLGPVDAAVRLTKQSFLLVVPGASEMHLARICDDVLDQLSLAADGYPRVRLTGGIATVVTRQRPLPLNDLHRALERSGALAGPGPAHAGRTSVGDRVTVCPIDASGQDSVPAAEPVASVRKDRSADPSPPHKPTHPRPAATNGKGEALGTLLVPHLDHCDIERYA